MIQYSTDYEQRTAQPPSPLAEHINAAAVNASEIIADQHVAKEGKIVSEELASSSAATAPQIATPLPATGSTLLLHNGMTNAACGSPASGQATCTTLQHQDIMNFLAFGDPAHTPPASADPCVPTYISP